MLLYNIYVVSDCNVKFILRFYDDYAMIYYARNLPHYHPERAILFITFRLTGTLSLEVLSTMRKNYELEQKKLYLIFSDPELYRIKLYNLQKKYFGLYDRYLDLEIFGPSWLINEEVAGIVASKILVLGKEKYELITYTIMPNHVHLVILPNEDLRVSKTNNSGKTKDYVVADMMRLLKGSTSREANKILNRASSFWHHESYDHVVRNETELDNIVRYVLNNPVNAGLVQKSKDWKWSYSLYDIVPI